ncbi:hypothetical protein D3C75_1261850 [compost metagenome]
MTASGVSLCFSRIVSSMPISSGLNIRGLEAAAPYIFTPTHKVISSAGKSRISRPAIGSIRQLPEKPRLVR